MHARGLRGVHVFWMISAFFAVVFAVDVFFIARAVSTFPGEQVKNSYVLGLNYNREVERREQQAALGWSVKAGVLTDGITRFVAQFADRSGAPLSGLAVSASYHSAGAGKEIVEVLLVEGAPGEYSAPVEFSSQRAEFAIKARRASAGDIVFEAAKTVLLP